MRRRWWKPGSIAARLFLSAAVLSFSILTIAGIVLSAIYSNAVENAFDEQLGVYLRALVSELATAGDDSHPNDGQLGNPQFELVDSGWYWQITKLGGDTADIRSSRSLFAARLPKLADQGVPAGIGGARKGYARGPDDRWLRIVERVIDTGDQGIFLVQVAATTEEIQAGIAQFRSYLVATFGLLGLTLVASAAVQTRYGLLPLRQLQQGVAAIRRGDSEKIAGRYPPDIAPLAGELNLLLSANREVVERARTQVGNLAHALKTPLSVILNEAGEDRGALAAKVQEQVAVMRTQVGYHLDRARAAVRAGTVGSMTEVAPVVEGLVRTFEKIYRERGLSFDAAAIAALRFAGERQDLEDMVGNLLDNAGKWARSSIRIEVAPAAAGPRPFFAITIDDDGPGLPAGQREDAMRRGRRLDETKPGSGLGLSIVVDLAGLYGGSFALAESPQGGLRALLRLPMT